MERALVVADDYTGAMDTGLGFAANGRSVQVVLAGPDSSGLERPGAVETDPDVLVVDADTRALEQKTAGATVSRLLADTPSIVYKKVDSTLRGNVASEVTAAVDAIDASIAVVAPAFPATGRLTANGIQFVDGIPLAQAGYGVESSTVKSQLEASPYDCEPLSIDTVAAGSDAIRTTLEATLSGEPTLVTCDALHERHLESIVTAAQSLEETVLFVGSGGLASALAVPQSGDSPALESPTGDVLGVVGSINERTLEQLGAVSDNRIVRIDPAKAVTDPHTAGTAAAEAIRNRLEAHGEAVVTSALESADVDKAREAAAAADCTDDPGDRISTALATAAAETARLAPLAGLFLTGGSVARSTLERLDVTTIELTGASVGDGIPVGYLVDGDLAGSRVITKAGGFGTEKSIVNCLTALAERNDCE
ncbi:four-carbon acid sugar kinase family protein [Natronolimnobius sp. AArcel1]|uniref:four-carbon acid sugar kinase family protein n=1 Tax=Natronolimnobius sp. AArcel1 TaxID=1679093 RepID=UPI0013EAAD1A|nr:four-carbon acid sugar kinase family protein [Natronolimnobius sp. AArcel1]NGM67968.1 four-carbon acid sugar kinase family protein [Natronolimnobius sp. AArcel1]